MKEEIKRIGLLQAERSGIAKRCPKDGGKPMLFAGEGSHDYEIVCDTCNFTVHRNSLKATITRWNVATSKAKRRQPPRDTPRRSHLAHKRKRPAQAGKSKKKRIPR